jgi:lipopolysaccharide export system protein LptC
MASTAFAPTTESLARRAGTIAAAHRRSRFLQVWRLICVAVAAGAAAAVLMAMALHALGGGFGAPRQVEVQESLTMINPRFTGRDGDGALYVITADTAVREGAKSERISLQRPRFEGEEGQAVTAQRGFYDPDLQTAELFDDVVFTDKENRSFRTSYAFIDAAQDIVRGTAAISGAAGLGEVRADSYELRRDGGHVILRGRVKGTISGSKPNP